MLQRVQRKKLNFCQGAYAPSFKNTPSDRHRIEIVLRLVGKNKIVLDVGCFDGVIGSLLIGNSNAVFGVELSKQAIKAAKERGLNVVLADVDEGLPFADHSFDVVFAGELIEHVLDVEFWLREVARIAKLNGELILTTPNLASLGRRLLLFAGKDPLTDQSLFSGAGHLRYFVRQTLLRLLEENNFKIVDFQSDVINLSAKGHVCSAKLARWFPSLGRGLIVKARPQKSFARTESEKKARPNQSNSILK